MDGRTGPARIHGFTDGVGLDRLIGAGPATDDGAIAEQGVGIALEFLLESAAKQLGAEPGGIDVKIGGQSLAGFGQERGDAVFTRFDGDGGIDDFHAEGSGYAFEPADEFFVFEMKGMVVVKDRGSVGTPWESFVAGHQGGDGPGAGGLLDEIEAIVAGEPLDALFELEGESVVERRPGTPKEFNAEFPGGFGFRIELLRF